MVAICAHVQRASPALDCLFFLRVNLRPRIKRFSDSEYSLLIGELAASRRRLGFLFCGYVLMPDHGRALIGPQVPLMPSLVGVPQPVAGSNLS